MTIEAEKPEACKHESAWFDRTICLRADGQERMASICDDCGVDIDLKPEGEMMSKDQCVSLPWIRTGSVHGMYTVCSKLTGEMICMVERESNADRIIQLANQSPEVASLRAEIASLRSERANEYANAERLNAWMSDPHRKPANTAFTDGPERQIAYCFEAEVERLKGTCHCGESNRMKSLLLDERSKVSSLQASAGALHDQLKKSNEELKLELKEQGGCDHSVGICACELIGLIEDNEAVLTSLSKEGKSSAGGGA